MYAVLVNIKFKRWVCLDNRYKLRAELVSENVRPFAPTILGLGSTISNY